MVQMYTEGVGGLGGGVSEITKERPSALMGGCDGGYEEVNRTLRAVRATNKKPSARVSVWGGGPSRWDELQ